MSWYCVLGIITPNQTPNYLLIHSTPKSFFVLFFCLFVCFLCNSYNILQSQNHHCVLFFTHSYFLSKQMERNKRKTNKQNKEQTK